MFSVLNEILKFRDDNNIIVDYTNSNRYRIVLIESNGTKTAYYFSSPIYNNKSRKILNLRFFDDENAVYSIGSNAYITYSDKIVMENADGLCTIPLDNNIKKVSLTRLQTGENFLFPTTNGFLYKIAIHEGQSAFFDLETEKTYLSIRSNEKSFSIMSEKFKPFVTVSCIGAEDDKGEITAPVKLNYKKLFDNTYRLIFTPCTSDTKYIVVELNLYEAKLVQDTTVESKNPSINNAFGGTAFLGCTEEFGEQWLYTRIDFLKFSDLFDNKLIRFVAHIPKLKETNIDLIAHKTFNRFCSFGSTWENKVPGVGLLSYLTRKKDYYDIDLTKCLIDNFGRFEQSDGLIIRGEKSSDFAVISTGDSCFAPQIFEINFK